MNNHKGHKGGGGILTININPGPEMLRPQKLARAASVLGLVVFGSGVAQLVLARQGKSANKQDEGELS